jgi:hypothetical protein
MPTNEHTMANDGYHNLDEENNLVIDKVGLAKRVISTTAGLCVGAVTNAAVRNNVHGLNRRGRFQVAVAAAVIGSMVAAKARKHVEEEFDEYADAIKKIRNIGKKED